jgi:hypothetical protein
MMQQNMLSDGDIGAAMFNANSHGGGQGAINPRMDGGEQADCGTGPGGAPMQMNQMVPGRRSLLVGNNNGSAFSFADGSASTSVANVTSNTRPSQMQNPLTTQQIQMLQKQNMNRRDNNRSSHVNIHGGLNPGANAVPQMGSPFAPAGMLSSSTEQQQQMQSINPNFNEVMNFDPVDGRDLRGRGRSRDASNSRVVGLHHQTQNQFNPNVLN